MILFFHLYSHQTHLLRSAAHVILTILLFLSFGILFQSLPLFLASAVQHIIDVYLGHITGRIMH